MGTSYHTYTTEDTCNLKNIAKKIKALIKKAGDITLHYFSSYQGYPISKDVHYKKDNSPVTEADKKTEDFLRKELIQSFPHFGIIGEEYDTYNGTARYKWVIDPIDGTRSFIKGIPLYTILIGLYDSTQNKPILGCIYCPTSGEYVYAIADEGAFFINLLTPHTSTPVLIQRNTTPTPLSDALVLSYDFVAGMKISPTIHKVMLHALLTRTWADGYAYILLACSRAHAVIDAKMHIWDVLPIYPIIKECGMCIHTFEGISIQWENLLSKENNKIKNTSINIVCSSSHMLSSEILEIIKK